MIACQFGCDLPAVHRFKTGKWCCSLATSSCPAMKKKNGAGVKRHMEQFEKPNDRWPRGHPRGALGKSSFRGRTYDEIYGEERSKSVRLKISESNLGRTSWDTMSDEKKEAHRERARTNILKRYAAGWMPKAGRCAKISHTSPSAGIVSLDGTWEAAMASYLDREGLTWKRNILRFEYYDATGKLRRYTPDFWVEEWNSYVEVKGYETELDRIKWSQFNENLQVWKKDRIMLIMEGGQAGNAADC